MKVAEPSEKALSRVTDPELWTEAVHEASREALDNSGGKRNWHARAAQRAVQIYKARGGGYLSDEKPRDGLVQWQEEEWVTLDPKTGNILGPCGTEHEDYPGVPLRCLARDRAEGMSPADRRKTARIKAEAAIGENVRNVDMMGRSRRRNPPRDYSDVLPSQDRTGYGSYTSPQDDMEGRNAAIWEQGLRETDRLAARSRRVEEEREHSAAQAYGQWAREEKSRRLQDRIRRARQEAARKERGAHKPHFSIPTGKMNGTMITTDPETGKDPVIRAHNAAEKATVAADNVYMATEDPVARAEVLHAAQVAEEAVTMTQEAAITGDAVGADEAAALAEDAAAVAQTVEEHTTGTVEEIPEIEDPNAPPTTEADAPEPRKFPIGLALLGGFIVYQLLS